MLNVKQGSSEYQLLKSFGLTRPGKIDYEANFLVIFYLILEFL